MRAFQSNKSVTHLFKNQGFTLIEMILVIVILGVLAIGTTTFIKYGMQIYGNSTDRQELIASARFAIERLNREVRSAVPNSIRVTNDITRQCLEFTPIVLSTVYTDIPVAPEGSSETIDVIAFNQSLFNEGFTPTLNVGVYLTSSSEFYNGTNDKIHTLLDNNIGNDDDDDEWELTLDDSVTFEQDSPTSRLYFFNHATSYCIDTVGRLIRHYDYDRNSNGTPDTDSDGVLMAENIIKGNNFLVDNASLLRNSIVSIRLNFERNNETVEFNHYIQVPNVP